MLLVWLSRRHHPEIKNGSSWLLSGTIIVLPVPTDNIVAEEAAVGIAARNTGRLNTEGQNIVQVQRRANGGRNRKQAAARAPEASTLAPPQEPVPTPEPTVMARKKRRRRSTSGGQDTMLNAQRERAKRRKKRKEAEAAAVATAATVQETEQRHPAAAAAEEIGAEGEGEECAVNINGAATCDASGNEPLSTPENYSGRVTLHFEPPWTTTSVDFAAPTNGLEAQDGKLCALLDSKDANPMAHTLHSGTNQRDDETPTTKAACNAGRTLNVPPALSVEDIGAVHVF
jgi:hypothetical protein